MKELNSWHRKCLQFESQSTESKFRDERKDIEAKKLTIGRENHDSKNFS